MPYTLLVPVVMIPVTLEARSTEARVSAVVEEEVEATEEEAASEEEMAVEETATVPETQSAPEQPESSVFPDFVASGSLADQPAAITTEAPIE